MRRHSLLLLLLFGIVSPVQAQPKGDPLPKEEELKGNVRIYLETGGHSERILYAAFKKGDTDMVTVGQDGSVQVWDVATGQRLKKLLLPVLSRYRTAALAPDGRTLAVSVMGDTFADKTTGRGVLLINLDDGRILPLMIAVGVQYDVKEALVFSPQGDQLAAGVEKQLRIWPIPAKLWDKVAKLPEPERMALLESRDYPPAKNNIHLLQYSPDGKHLAATHTLHLIYDTGPGGNKKKGVQLEPIKGKEGKPSNYPIKSLAWSADSTTLYTAADGGQRGIVAWNVQGKQQAKYSPSSKKGDDLDWLRTFAQLSVLQPLGDSTLLVGGTVRSEAAGDIINHIGMAALDLKSGSFRNLLKETDLADNVSLTAVSHNRKLAATTVNGGRDIVFWRTADGKVVRRLESKAQTPVRVGWGKDKKQYVLAWGYGTDPAQKNFGKFARAFDLEKLRFVDAQDFKLADYTGRLHQLGQWSVIRKPNSLSFIQLAKKGQNIAEIGRGGGGSTFSLAPRDGDDPLLVFGIKGLLHLASITTGAEIKDKEVGPNFKYYLGFNTLFAHVQDLAPSPAGKYLAVATGSQKITLLNLKTGAKMLELYFAGQDWIAWTDSGHYAASPGGEKLMGWAASDGIKAPATFHPASRFRKQFYRPDVIGILLQVGDFKKALATANAILKAQGKKVQKEVDLESVLPPTGFIDKVDSVKLPKLTVHVKAAAHAKDLLTKLELLADGRPLFGAAGVRQLAKPLQHAAATFVVELPPGNYKLTVRIHSQKSWSTSSEAHLTYSLSAPPQQPKAKLHVLAVGASLYKNHAGLNLLSPANDAKRIAEVMPKQCGAPLFAAGMCQCFIGEEATSSNVYQAVANLSKEVKPEDVAVIYFGGHGLKAPTGGLYLLTYDTNMNDLDKTALSGARLRDALSKIECRGVILILDACHSGSIGPKAKPVVDDLTRELTDDDCGVVVWCAAMGYEKAQVDDKTKHGLFTLKFLEALDPKNGARPSKHDGKVYLNSIQSYVFEEVLHDSGQRQHPSLNIPWTVETFPLRAQSKGKGETGG